MTQKMIGDVDIAFGRFRNMAGERYFEWKPDSLEFIVNSSMAVGPQDELKLIHDEHVLQYKRKDSIILLGDSFDKDGSTSHSLEFNFGRAESSYFKNQKLVCDRIQSIKTRLKAWSTSPGATAPYNSVRGT